MASAPAADAISMLSLRYSFAYLFAKYAIHEKKTMTGSFGLFHDCRFEREEQME
jgi:hypothetical protein